MIHLIWVFSALALTAIAQEIPHFEIDVIFPRNETYKPSDVFPVALAIQNLTAVGTIGNFTFSWDFMPYSDGRTPGGITYGMGEFPISDAASGTSVIFVDFNNITEWIYRKERGEQYMLNWHVRWDGLSERCGYDNSIVFGGLMFSIETDWEVKFEGGRKGKAPDILQVPECPVLGSVVKIRPNSKDRLCPIVEDENTGSDDGNPCAIKVDKAVALSISSHAANLATPLPTSTSTWASTSTGGVGVAFPVQTALAAACLLYCLA